MLLTKMRSGIFSYLFLGFIIMAAAGLIMMDWTGSYSGTGGSNNVAVVGKDAIGSVEFDRTARRIIRSQQIDTDLAYKAGLIDQILEMKIMDMLLQKAARDYGVIVEDALVAKQISTMLEPMAAQSGSTKKEVLTRILQSQGMSEADLVSNLRGDMERSVLRTAVTQALYVPNAMAQDLYAYQHESRTAEAVLIAFDSMKVSEPDDVDLGTYFDKVKTQYTEPESRSFKIAVLNPDDLGGKIEISDKEVRAYYDQNRESFKSNERRLLQQAVIDNEQKATDILKQAKDKKSLKDAVKAVTGDTKAFSNDSGYERAGLPAQLADPVFSAEENSYIGPIKTPLGYHVIYVKTKQPAQIQPFEDLKESIKRELSHTRKADDIFEATSLIEDRLAAGEPLEDLAKEMGMTVSSAKDVRMSTRDIPALKPFGEDETAILNTAFSASEHEATPLAELKDGRMYTVRVDTIKPKRQKELKEVKADVIKGWTEEQRRKQVGAAATKALDELDNKKSTLADIAKANNTTVQTFADIKRTSEKPPAGLTEGNLKQIMTTGKGINIVMPTDKGILVGHVTAIKPVAKTPTAQELTETKEKLGADTSQENLLSFVDELQKKYKTVKNQKLLERMYGQSADQGL
jgi:peptidyl-prolyl cis-trans isomerase D